MVLHRFRYTSPFGDIIILQDTSKVIEITLPGSDDSIPMLSKHSLLYDELSGYFSGNTDHFSVLFQLNRGTEFQRKVWKAISAISYAHTKTYKEIAIEIGHPNAVRAVGTACGKNPVPILIPCHRVVSSSGIGGFAWGSTWKEYLLSLERRG